MYSGQPAGNSTTLPEEAGSLRAPAHFFEVVTCMHRTGYDCCSKMKESDGLVSSMAHHF
jgi:hypothetical protein